VQLEVSPAEGAAGHEIHWTGNGSSTLNVWVCAPRRTAARHDYLPHRAELHACTDHTDLERPNDRYRDLIDLILVDRAHRCRASERLTGPLNRGSKPPARTLAPFKDQVSCLEQGTEGDGFEPSGQGLPDQQLSRLQGGDKA